jgi:hypothetical protein
MLLFRDLLPLKTRTSAIDRELRLPERQVSEENGCDKPFSMTATVDPQAAKRSKAAHTVARARRFGGAMTERIGGWSRIIPGFELPIEATPPDVWPLYPFPAQSVGGMKPRLRR